MKRRPDGYIKTGNVSFLAFIKLLEVLAVSLIVVALLANKDTLTEQIHQILYLRQLFGTDDSYRIYLYTIMGIFIGDVVLMILDGLACLLTRAAKKGAGIVAFCHIVRCIFLSVALVVSVYDVFSRISGVRALANSNPFLLFGIPYFFAGSLVYLLVGIERIIGLFIIAKYHFGVFKIMHCVSKEIKADEVLATKESVYLTGKRASHIAIFIIIGVIVDLIGRNTIGTIMSAHALFTNPIYMAFMEIPIACWIIMVLIVIKFFVVSGCSAEFESAHLGISSGNKEQNEDEKKATENEAVNTESKQNP